jgi:hypothetical protein
LRDLRQDEGNGGVKAGTDPVAPASGASDRGIGLLVCSGL